MARGLNLRSQGILKQRQRFLEHDITVFDKERTQMRFKAQNLKH